MTNEIRKLKAKTFVASWLSFAWCRLGGSKDVLGRFPRFADEFLIGSVRALRRSEPEVSARPLKVVFFTILGSHSFMTGTDVALAHALRKRGHEVSLVICDRVLPLCENKSVNNANRWAEVCGKCALRGEAMLRASGLEYRHLSDLVMEATTADVDRELREIDLSHAVESSLYKHFRVGRLQDTEEVRAAAERLEEASKMSARAALAIAMRDPDRVVMSHGIYSTWAPALAVFNRAGIPVAVYNKGKRRNSGVVNWVTGVMEWDVSEEWARVGRTELASDERRRIENYLASRRTHDSDALVYNFGEVETRDALLSRLGLIPELPVFVLLTNVLWDASSAQKEIAFPNAVDWVMETIDWFASRPDKQLVVKIHPAEVVIGTNQPFASEIRQRFPVLPSNVRVIEPGERVNSWSMPLIATAGLVHTSTAGLELPLEGVPCILVSSSHYRGKGFTIDVESRDEYFHRIDHWDPADINTDEMREAALRYAYLLFERYHLDWGFTREAGFGRHYAIDASDDSELTEDETIDLLCTSIEQQSDFLYGSGNARRQGWAARDRT